MSLINQFFPGDSKPEKLIKLASLAGVCLALSSPLIGEPYRSRDALQSFLISSDIVDFSPESVHVFLPPFPPSLKHGEVESDTHIGLRVERIAWFINNPPLDNTSPPVDFKVPPPGSDWITLNKFNRPFFGEIEYITSRERVNIYYLHYDPIGSSPRIAGTVAKIRFKHEIIGVIFTGDSNENFVRGNTLDMTRHYAVTPYAKPRNADFRRQGSLDGSPQANYIKISPDRKTLEVAVACKSFHMDNMRIITNRRLVTN